MTAIRLLVSIGSFIVALYGPAQQQANPDLPLSKTELINLYKYEQDALKSKDKAVLEGLTKAEVERVGVSFEVNPDIERELRTAGMFGNLIEVIRQNNKTGTLTIRCEPIECQVTVNNEPAGSTFASVLRKNQVTAGTATVQVTAPNYEPKTAQVQVAAGGRVEVPVFRLDPVKGGLDITCKPDDCSVAIKGDNNYARTAKTMSGRLTITGMATGGYDLEVTGECFVPQVHKIYVAAPNIRAVPVTLVDDSWCRMTPLELFDSVVNSLGGKPVLTIGAKSQNSARMRLTGDPASIGTYNAVQVVEYVASTPDRLRWDLTIAGTKWRVVFDGQKAESSGDSKRYSGTEFGQELEHSIRLFASMRLPAVLSLIRAKFDIKKGTERVMIAETSEERYTFDLGEDFLPLKVRHEQFTPRSVEEMQFAQFKDVGQDLKLPHVVILRYPDRPKHEHLFEYDKIDITAPIKDSLFQEVAQGKRDPMNC